MVDNGGARFFVVSLLTTFRMLMITILMNGFVSVLMNSVITFGILEEPLFINLNIL